MPFYHARSVAKPPRAILATMGLLVVGGCAAPVPGTQLQVPSAISGASQAPVVIGQMPGISTDHIFRLESNPGRPATFDTVPGRSLTIVACAASSSAIPPSFRLDVSPQVATATPRGYDLASTPFDVAMPYRATFTAANQALLNAAKPSRTLLDVAAPVHTLGAKETFWISNGDSKGAIDVQQTATLKRVTSHALIYLDQAATNFSEAHLDDLAKEFESNIYPKEAAVFGTPPVPGIDGGDHVSIVISPAVDNFGKEKGLMGYFWSRDALPGGSGGAHSNQRYVLFMTDQLFNYPALTSFGTMAHEYQHLLNFTHKAINSGYAVAEETWLDEGMAMYAMEVTGYGMPAGDKLIAKDLNEFQHNPLAYSLTDWDNNPHHFAYGQNYLFVRYLVDRYGPDAIKEILASRKTGVDCLEDVLNKRNDTFAGFFSAWAIANLISGTPLAANTIYQYKGLDLAGNFGGFQLHGIESTPVTNPEASVSLRPWGSAYLNYASTNQQSWHLDLADPGSTRLLGAAIVP